MANTFVITLENIENLTVDLPFKSTNVSDTFDVNWGDSSAIDTGSTSYLSHAYTIANATVTITVNNINSPYEFDSGDTLTFFEEKITSVTSWGNILWSVLKFNLASNLLSVPLTAPNTTDMTEMFNAASSFNQDISSWNVSSVTDMTNMFNTASSFNQDISTWNVGNVTSMLGMFSGASVFNQSLSGWDVSSVTNMASMFYTAYAFNQDLSTWNVSNVTDMNNMFGFASSFNGNITNWNTGQVTNFTSTFFSASAFNQNISSWNTGQVIVIENMFNTASSFNQNIGNWNVNTVDNATGALNDCGMSRSNYEATLLGWSATAAVNSGTVGLGAVNLIYCNETGRNALLLVWQIFGDTQDCSGVEPEAEVEPEVEPEAEAEAEAEEEPITKNFSIEIESKSKSGNIFSKIINVKQSTDVIFQNKILESFEHIIQNYLETEYFLPTLPSFQYFFYDSVSEEIIDKNLLIQYLGQDFDESSKEYMFISFLINNSFEFFVKNFRNFYKNNTQTSFFRTYSLLKYRSELSNSIFKISIQF